MSCRGGQAVLLRVGERDRRTCLCPAERPAGRGRLMCRALQDADWLSRRGQCYSHSQGHGVHSIILLEGLTCGQGRCGSAALREVPCFSHRQNCWLLCTVGTHLWPGRRSRATPEPEAWCGEDSESSKPQTAALLCRHAASQQGLPQSHKCSPVTRVPRQRPSAGGAGDAPLIQAQPLRLSTLSTPGACLRQ